MAFADDSGSTSSGPTRRRQIPRFLGGRLPGARFVAGSAAAVDLFAGAFLAVAFFAGFSAGVFLARLGATRGGSPGIFG